MEFLVKTRDIHKIKRKNYPIRIFFFFGNKNKKKYQIYVSKNAVKINMLIHYWYENKAKGTMFLSNILICSCMVIHYIVAENIFVVIVFKLLGQHTIEMSY